MIDTMNQSENREWNVQERWWDVSGRYVYTFAGMTICALIHISERGVNKHHYMIGYYLHSLSKRSWRMSHLPTSLLVVWEYLLLPCLASKFSSAYLMMIFHNLSFRFLVEFIYWCMTSPSLPPWKQSHLLYQVLYQYFLRWGSCMTWKLWLWPHG